MLSIIIPFYNEEDNLKPLYEELKNTLKKQKDSYEIIFVNDGSTDKSADVVTDLASKDEQVVILNQRKRFGKGEALAQGVSQTKGSVIVFMDADLQDDPKHLPEFIKKIHEGYDLVNGIRVVRKDSAVIRTYTGAVNKVLSVLLKSPFTDINCGFKAFKKEVLSEIALYGNNFRFFPLAAYYRGYRVTEAPVNNRPRVAGKSKFGPSKLFVGLLDTLTAYFLFKFSERPLHFFGALGGILFAPGFLLALYLTYERLFRGVLLYRRPALLLAILLIMVGLQIVLTGIIGELIVYLHKKSIQ